MNLLLITYSFPPSGGVGVHRALSFAKYFPTSGVCVHVLTARNPSAVGNDESLLAGVPGEVRIHRIASFDIPFGIKKLLKKFITKRKTNQSNLNQSSGVFGKIVQFAKNRLVPDPQVFWVRPALKEALRIIDDEKIDTVLVTVPPFSALQIGIELKKVRPDVKVISDFRDEWLTYYFYRINLNQSLHARKVAEQIERDAVQKSDLVVAVTESTVREMKARYPLEREDKFALVPNGFDPALFKGVVPSCIQQSASKLIFTYAGTLYGPTDPRPLVKAIQHLAPDIRQRLKFRFIGYIEDVDYRSALEQVSDCISFEPFIPQREVIGQLIASDYLLLLWRDDLNIPGKLYDYVGTRKPILAITTQSSDVRKRISQTRTGWCVDCDNSDEIALFLTRVVSEHDSPSRAFCPDEAEIRRFERPSLAHQYVSILRECSERVSQGTYAGRS